MVTARDTVGRPVVQAGTGKSLGRVHQVLLDPRGQTVVALQVAPATWLSPARAIPWERVRSLGPDRVVAEGEPLELSALGQEALDLERLAERTPYAAAEAATLNDVVFEPATGRVVGYRLSGGFLQDLLDGRDFLPADQMAPTGSVGPAGGTGAQAARSDGG